MAILKNVPEIGALLQGHSNEDIDSRIAQMREAVIRDAAQDPKIAEFDLLGSGHKVIGKDDRREPLFAETLENVDGQRCLTIEGHPFLQLVVAIHRLKAVVCLYGFTRLEPSPTIAEAMLEDVRLAVDGVPLSEAAEWLPAMEQFGEGIFLKVRPDAIRAWAAKAPVKDRVCSCNGDWKSKTPDTIPSRETPVCHTSFSTAFRMH